METKELKPGDVVRVVGMDYCVKSIPDDLLGVNSEY